MVILALWMLLFFLSPFIYLLIAVLVAKAAIKRGVLVLLASILAFSILPAYLYMDYWKFTEACDKPRKPVTHAPIDDVDSIIFVIEDNGPLKPFIWPREMNLHLSRYESGYIVPGKKAAMYGGGDIRSRYMFLVTSPKKTDDGVVASNIAVIDRRSGEALYEAQEFVFGGFVAGYHGLFLAQHRGALACGYLGRSIYPWRPNDSNGSRKLYAEVDAEILATLFPSLRTK